MHKSHPPCDHKWRLTDCTLTIVFQDWCLFLFVCVEGCDICPQLQVGTRSLIQPGANAATLTSSEKLLLLVSVGPLWFRNWTCDLDSCSQERRVAAGVWIVSKCQGKIRVDAGQWNELCSSPADQCHYPCDKAVKADFEEQLRLCDRSVLPANEWSRSWLAGPFLQLRAGIKC